MADVAAVKPAPSQKGQPKPRSEVSAPYYDLDKSIEVAKVIHEQAGGGCDRAQLAALLKYSGVKNGGFLTRVSAAKMFGLIEENSDRLKLTERAKSVLSPVRPEDAARAKVDAFLNVELFRRVYQQFEGQTLPAEVGLKNLLQTSYKLVPDRVVPALRVLMDSAQSAGFFELTGNRSRMTRPLVASGDFVPPPPQEERPRDDAVAMGGGGSGSGNGTGNGSGGGEETGIDPALLGLIKNLPPKGSKLGPKRRKALTDAFAATIDFLYPEEE